MTGKNGATPRLCPAFDPDPDLGTDWRGRRTCRNCNRPGTPDDPGHTPPTPPIQQTRISPEIAAAAQARDAAILGEHDDQEYR